MSLKKTLCSSFRSKPFIEKEVPEKCSNGCDETELIVTPPLSEGNNRDGVPLENGAILLENHSSVNVSQAGDTKGSVGELSASDSDNAITEYRTDEQTVLRDPLSETSFAMPDGVAMDPMAPTALAVSTEFMERIGSGLTLLRDHGKKVQKYVWKSRKFDVLRKSWKSVVNIVLVDAKDLPDGPETGTNCVYCKFRLGSESHKTKPVPNTSRPTWRERFNLHVYEDNNLELSVWHKGKQKNFMGRCLLDLSQLERERTHELWQELECGFGTVHLLVTVSGSSRPIPLDNVPTTNGIYQHLQPAEDKFAWYRLEDWTEVGQLSVTVHGAKGLSTIIGGKADAFCVMELDNSRVQTHTIHGSSEPNWNKTYTFDINDITSTLDITIFNESIYSAKCDTLGKISIPLLRINNDEKRWYALKDRTKKGSAKGNCPRILLEMSVVWNPIKASVRVLSPKEMKYIQKPPKFDIPLVYSNLKFVKDVFNAIAAGNEYYKRLFEWENREKSALALIGWLAFWYFMKLWLAPLLLLAPFLYNWSGYKSCNNNALVPIYQAEEETEESETESQKDEKTIKNRIYGLQDLTFTIKNGIDYIVSLLERIKNLGNFTVPYLSYLAMTVLVAAAVILYIVPVNYLLMILGIYKFTRKFLRPERAPNNDLLDFLSRVPDNEILKQWRELKVPEPVLNRPTSVKNHCP